MMLYDQISEIHAGETDAGEGEGGGSKKNDRKHVFRAETTKLSEVINLFK